MHTRIRQLTASTELVTRFILAVLLASAVFLAVTRESHACSCGHPQSAGEALEASSHVFVGEVVALLDSRYENNSMFPSEIYEFKVTNVLKGPLYETVYLSVGGPCGASFVVGLTYLVYTPAGYCSKTSLLSTAYQDFFELGPGRPPEPGTSEGIPSRLDELRRLDERIAETRWNLALAATALTLSAGLFVGFRTYKRLSSERTIAEIQRQARARTQGPRHKGS